MDIKVFGIIGAGQMGSGIAQVAAVMGLDVILNDINETLVQKGYASIEARLIRQVEKGKISAQEKKKICDHIRTSIDLKDMAKADFIVEAATESESLKFKIFQDLDNICKPQTILASNTSSIPIGRIANQTKRPENVIGMHFMNPVPAIKLVEVIRGLATCDTTFKNTLKLATALGKTPVSAQDYPGFIANRILLPMINEAIYTLYHGVGSREDIDTVMKLGMNHPMGPLALADLIGLDTCLAIMETLYNGFKDSKYRPCPLLRKYVEAGWLGKKTGRGFYQYQ
jgi:3-hydroxybutyryl-CoA dehydrogenase